MATAKQIAANQSNAKKSSGPKTAEGKRNSSKNALTHGFTAKVHSMDCESHAEYQALRDHYLERYPPADEAQREIVEQMTHSQWNMRRLRLMEKGLMDHLYDKVFNDEPDDCEWEETLAEDRDEEWDGHLPGSEDDDTRRMAASFDRGQKTLIRFARYQAHFSAQWWRCYRKLEKLHPAKPEPDKLGSISKNSDDPGTKAKATIRNQTKPATGTALWSIRKRLRTRALRR